MPRLLVKRLVPHASSPMRATDGSAGYDVYAAEAVTIPAKCYGTVPTGIAIRVPAGTYGRIAPRSGLAARMGIDVLAGVVDADFTGEVIVILMNNGDADFKVAIGDRIAQLILERVELAPVYNVDELPETTRGAGGFGSTGTD
jgi:deoxyuridine 5'-triphosphate nucleotidohydrolase